MPVLLDKILRAGEGKIFKRLEAIVKQVNSIEDDFVSMSDEDLRGMTDEFRKRLADGEQVDDLLPEAFATVREAAKRVIGQRPYDVQIMGGTALHLGNIAEMKTGEGKTLVATLPSYLNALTGNGVHVVTVNDYLARYHAEWMGRIHRFLGLEVGVILNGLTPAQRREAYAADITYGTNNEFGFDYLRDNMAQRVEDQVQRGHHFAIVDEVDSILIDEARTPLIISGPADQPTRWYTEFSKIAQRLRRDTDYEVDEKKRTVGVLEPGIERVEDWLGIDNLYESANTPLIQFLNNSIKAKELYRRDKEYVVKDGEVLIVDEHTGRILGGRRYNEGMHQAIEAKEGVEIKQENQTLATITLQNFFRLYDKLSGMTGTAMTEAGEFDKIYGLGVVPIPPNRPLARLDEDDEIYRTEEAKFNAVVEDLVERHRKGQPVLVGTTSVEKSERLSQLLRKRGVPHEVLNAKQHEREAAIVAQAGRKGAVTVATNMAGRGTDIMLGGNHEFMAQAELKQRGLDPIEDADEYNAAEIAILEKLDAQVSAEREEVRALGGLYVLGTERHESRRIDNQLRGRSGRQGDPGESRFYLSLQDDLMRLFKSEWVEMIMRTFNQPDDVPISHKRVSNAVRSAQTQREAQNFEMRKDVLKYDDVLNRQRMVIYDERARVLHGEDLHEQVTGMLDDAVTAYVQGATAGNYPEHWDLDQLWTALKTLYPVGVTVEEVEQEAGGRNALTAAGLTERLVEDAHAALARREESLGVDVMRELERRVLLTVLDRKWREHLYEMDYLREGIGLRAFAQKQPLVEYQREGFDLFVAMMDAIKEESVGLVFNLEVQVQAPGDAAAAPTAPGAPVVQAKGLGGAQRPQQLQYTAPTVDGDGAVQRRVEQVRPAAARAATGGAATGGAVVASGANGERGSHAAGADEGDLDFSNVSRNALCPCGSGKKFKRCHGDPRHASQSSEQPAG
ncbi:preprotein translocase subunit SecA [Jiangella ureilytica]|uniref:Protein translocase subunit SecA n=1 Tax=Jiangella ureilytica TaxID=2530374 RepID=A0A4R4RCF7_9ACTN|nr:preprotein translocase subunit SecA [Jiangella ureilytica]TDC46776.1 preprotein translocase subunit SecA [Jiangella ureilytica]